MTEGQSPRNAPPMAVAAILAWLLPGLGHWFLGEKKRAIIFFIVIMATFWGGVAVGGVRSAVSPRDNGLWIAAQVCAGPQTFALLSVSNKLAAKPDLQQQFKAPWPASDISVVYAGVAGLLNLLIILDVLARSEANRAAVASRGPPRKVGPLK